MYMKHKHQSSHHRGNEAEISEVMEVFTLIITRPITGEPLLFRDSTNQLVILESLSP